MHSLANSYSERCQCKQPGTEPAYSNSYQLMACGAVVRGPTTDRLLHGVKRSTIISCVSLWPFLSRYIAVALVFYSRGRVPATAALGNHHLKQVWHVHVRTGAQCNPHYDRCSPSCECCSPSCSPRCSPRCDHCSPRCDSCRPRCDRCSHHCNRTLNTVWHKLLQVDAIVRLVTDEDLTSHDDEREAILLPLLVADVELAL